jgi:hypothetical protein
VFPSSARKMFFDREIRFTWRKDEYPDMIAIQGTDAEVALQNKPNNVVDAPLARLVIRGGS